MRPLYSAPAWTLFESVFHRRMARQLETTVIRGLPAGLRAPWPLLLVANHTSWWDGFLLRQVHRRLRPTAPLYTVMRQDQLRRHRFLRLLGALPLEPGSAASGLRLMRTLRQARRHSPTLVLSFFPQGRIYPSWKRPLGFRRGIATLSRLLAPLTVLPLGLHIEALGNERPTAFIAAGPTLDVGLEGAQPQELEAAVEAQLDFTHNWIAAHGEDAAAGFATARPVFPETG
jgi:1-acyl-sn-glycerol-3-phosphate acyltransferase